MLAHLQSLPEVSKACVEITGRNFLLISKSDSLAPQIIAAALEVLGSGSSQVGPGWEEEEVAGIDPGGFWLDCTNLVRLSLLEARILAAHWGEAAALEAKLDGRAVDSFVRHLRVELSEEFRTIHGEGGTTDRAWYVARFPLVFDRCLRRMGRAVSEAEREVLRASLLRRLI